jgi:hypothetical protein
VSNLPGAGSFEVVATPGEALPAGVLGVSAELGVEVARAESALLVPAGAVRTEGETSYVLVLRAEGAEERVEVVTGLTDGEDVEIREGLKEGDEVRLGAGEEE